MKKHLYILTISFLLFNLSSCYYDKIMTTQKDYMGCLKKEKDTLKMDERNKVYQVITVQGDTINFNKKYAGKISPDGVIGLQQVHLLYESADSIVFNEKSLQLIWINNVKYGFIEQDQTGYFCYVSDTVFIPFSKIKKMKVNKYNKHLTAAAIIVPSLIFINIMVVRRIGIPIGL